MSRQRSQGTSLETATSAYLEGLGDVTREPLHGSRDVGDIHGIYLAGAPVVVECKHYRGRYELSEWTGELEREMRNAGTPYGFVVAKRRGFSLENNPGAQYAITTLETMAAILAAVRGE